MPRASSLCCALLALAFATTLSAPTGDLHSLLTSSPSLPPLETEPDSAASPPPLRWGRFGHIITGIIAQNLLTPAVAAVVRTLIPDFGGQLGNVTNWADDVKSRSDYFWSAKLHFINTPDRLCQYSHTRDCVADQCVSGAISNYTTRLAQQTGAQREEALKFLTHFLGDIHQPLHVGFTSDLGGNTINVRYRNKSLHLHALWDTDLIFTILDTNFNGSFSVYARRLVTLIRSDWAAEARTWVQCSKSSFPCPDEWATESIGVACSRAYVHVNGSYIQTGDAIEPEYDAFVRPVIDKQLAKSGVRMAQIINQVLGGRAEAMDNES